MEPLRSPREPPPWLQGVCSRASVAGFVTAVQVAVPGVKLSLVPAGQILVSQIVFGLASKSVGFAFRDAGRFEFKGISGGNAVYAVMRNV